MALILQKTRLHEGQWEGTLDGAGQNAPEVEALHLGQPLAGLEVTHAQSGEWLVTLPIPSAILSDGIQTVIFTLKGSQDVIGKETFLAGDALDEDLRAELDLLRTELDMLKKAFRRHCSES